LKKLDRIHFRLVAALTLVVALVSVSSAKSPPPSPTPSLAPAPTALRFGHEFIVLEENTGYSDVVGNVAEMPYFNSLIRQGALATNYYANFHPSLPNYLELTGGSNNGVTTDECSDGPSFVPSISADNVVRELADAGVPWREYAEGLDVVGDIACDIAQYYDSDHVPFRGYTDVQYNLLEQANIVPFTQFATDLKNGTFAQYNFVTPNMIDDAHSCPHFAGNCSLMPIRG
jgi:hypothetical protein